MKVVHLFISIVLIALLQSCVNAPAKEQETVITPQIDSTFISVTSESNTDTVSYSRNPEPLTFQDTTLTLKFEEFSLNINRFIVYEEDTDLYKDVLRQDTIEVNAELGETLEGQKITILSKEPIDVTVEQAYETSVTIMDEGPHCDLTDWKHFTSAWDTLPALKRNTYIAKEYTERDWERFPEVSINELKAAVKKVCGEEWVQHIKKVKSPTQYPSGVGVCRYFLRITGRENGSGKIFSKLIIIGVPMGC